MKDFAGWTITNALMALADADAVFMHCLPAHRGEEVAAEVCDGPRSVIYDEAENRLHVQKAILVTLMGAALSRARLSSRVAARRPLLVLAACARKAARSGAPRQPRGRRPRVRHAREGPGRAGARGEGSVAATLARALPCGSARRRRDSRPRHGGRRRRLDAAAALERARGPRGAREARRAGRGLRAQPGRAVEPLPDPPRARLRSRTLGNARGRRRRRRRSSRTTTSSDPLAGTMLAFVPARSDPPPAFRGRARAGGPLAARASRPRSSPWACRTG